VLAVQASCSKETIFALGITAMIARQKKLRKIYKTEGKTDIFAYKSCSACSWKSIIFIILALL